MQAEDIRQADEETARPARDRRDRRPKQPPGLFERFLSFLVGGNDPERERRRMLREISKLLKSSRYKFYKPKTEEATPAMARFFYELYTIAGPAQVLLGHAESSGVLKSIIVERSFTSEQAQLRASLTEESIAKRADEADMEAVAAEVKENLVAFLAGFDQAKVKEVNAAYHLLSVFLDVVHFDYYLLLKKFDSNLPERDFKYQPHFDTIQASYVLDDLKDYLSLVYLIDGKASWDFLLDVLREYRGIDIVDHSRWRKYLRLAVEMRRSRVLELIVQHVSKDPRYRTKILSSSEKIVEDYLAKLKSQSEITVQKLVREKQNRRIETLAKTVFGATAVVRAKNYTERYNALFAQRLVGGFTHIAPLNYLKAFLTDYFTKEIREIADLLIVRGRWSTPLMSQQLSEAYHVLLQTSDDLVALDDSLADEADLGIRIKGLIWKAERDKSAVKSLRQVVRETNEKAFALIVRAAQNLVVMGKSFKIVLEDYDKKRRELIINWKEIEGAADGDVRGKIVEAYKRIYYFIQLMQMYAKKST